MKKWLKLNYKFYVVAFVAFVVVMIKNIFQVNEFYLYNTFNESKLPLEAKLLNAVSDLSSVNYQFFELYPKLLIVGFIILHGIMLWGQRNKSEREFLETLPVKREMFSIYRFAMDVITMISALIITCIVTYLHLYTNFLDYEITLPWLASSIFGYGATLCCYMILILGVMYVLESFVVRGDLKIITTVGCMAMFNFSTSWIYEAAIFGQNHIFNKFIGFIRMYGVGDKTIFMHSDGWYKYIEWIEKDMPYDLYYQGQVFEFATGANCIDDVRSMWGYTDGVVSMSHPKLYIGFALAYLIIGALLFAFGIYLIKKQDLAKKGFYFDFAFIVVGVLIFATVFTYFITIIPEYWYSCILMGLIAFLVFMYLVRGKHVMKNKYLC